jgi:hypothetical protein
MCARCAPSREVSAAGTDRHHDATQAIKATPISRFRERRRLSTDVLSASLLAGRVCSLDGQVEVIEAMDGRCVAVKKTECHAAIAVFGERC